jgi:hypothetical protein
MQSKEYAVATNNPTSLLYLSAGEKIEKSILENGVETLFSSYFSRGNLHLSFETSMGEVAHSFAQNIAMILSAFPSVTYFNNNVSKAALIYIRVGCFRIRLQ